MTTMRLLAEWLGLAILVFGAPLTYVAAAQATAPQASSSGKTLHFDVASVKAATVPDGMTITGGGGMTVRKGSGIQIPRNTGGPGTDDPGRIHYPLISVKNLLRRAFDSYFEILAPDWLDSDMVQVDATMPADTTKEQFREMLGNLLTDRFQLKYHGEPKQIMGYALVVAKGGLKLKESADAPAAQGSDDKDGRPSPRPRQMGPDGFFIPPADIGPGFMFEGQAGDRARMMGRHQTMQGLADALGFALHTKVTDATGLKAKYDITVTYAGTLGGPRLMPEAAAVPDHTVLPDIFSALQSQIGLKLETRKVGVETLVVDHMEKTPTGN